MSGEWFFLPDLLCNTAQHTATLVALHALVLAPPESDSPFSSLPACVFDCSPFSSFLQLETNTMITGLTSESVIHADYDTWRKELCRQVWGNHPIDCKSLCATASAIQTADGNYHQITHMNLSSVPAVTDNNLELLAMVCPSLKYVNLAAGKQAAKFTAKGLKDLFTFSKGIECLILSGCVDVVHAKSMKPIMSALPLLKYLDVANCTKIDAAGLNAIFFHKNITRVVLRGCTQITDTMIEGVFKTKPAKCSTSSIVSLDLSECPGITEVGLTVIFREVTRLQYLKLERCTGITDVAVKVIASSAAISTLMSLNLSNCDFVTEKGFKELAVARNTCCELHLRGCRNLSNGIVLKLIMHCSNLKRLSVTNCCKLTKEGIQDLRANYPSVAIEY
eukprot:PhF_6_TR38965/c0_g1_i1/m.58305/K10273/FBXL7; F-box and leucine-rich repeat protein 7